MTESVNLKTGYLKLCSLRSKKKKIRIKESEQSLRNVWDTSKKINLWIMGFLKGEILFEEVLSSDIQHLRKDTDLHIQNKAAIKETKNEV